MAHCSECGDKLTKYNRSEWHDYLCTTCMDEATEGMSESTNVCPRCGNEFTCPDDWEQLYCSDCS